MWTETLEFEQKSSSHSDSSEFQGQLISPRVLVSLENTYIRTWHCALVFFLSSKLSTNWFFQMLINKQLYFSPTTLVKYSAKIAAQSPPRHWREINVRPFPKRAPVCTSWLASISPFSKVYICLTTSPFFPFRDWSLRALNIFLTYCRNVTFLLQITLTQKQNQCTSSVRNLWTRGKPEIRQRFGGIREF